MATRGKPQTKEAKLLDMLYGKPAAGDLRNTPMLKQTGEGSYLRQQYPEVYGFGAGMLGTLPDDISGSVLDPNTARVKQGAKYGLPTGVALETTPLVGPALKGAKMTGKALGAGLNEAIYHGAQSPLSKFIPEAVKPLNVVKPKGGGGNWFNVEKNTGSLKPNAGIDPKDAYELGISNRGDVAISNWIDTKLNKYIKNEMGTPDDPVRKLAEQGKLHFEPDVSNSMRLRAQQHRGLAGYPTEGSAGSQLAADWEALTDAQIQGGKARNSTVWPDPSIKAEAGEGSWIHNVDPDSDVYKFGTSYQPTKMLGFDHIIDELRNATTAGDALPKVLQIDPAKLERMSMSDVVNHVSKINEWRVNQAERSFDSLIKVLEKSPVTTVMKEYPDGYKWVELKIPDVSPERMAEGSPESIADFLKFQQETLRKPEAEARRALNLWAAPREWKDDLAKALKLEGDSMGHCVGGYCQHVLDGETRIFSLRDPKGRSHATIEAIPDKTMLYKRWIKDATEEEKQSFSAYIAKRGMNDINEDLTDWGRSIGKPISTEPVYNIAQIKGKGNARPIEKYDPYTQDFVQSNDWHIVDELQNTGLVDLGNKNYKSMEEIKKTYQYLDDTVDPPQWTNLGELVERDFPNKTRRDNFLTGVAERLREQATRTDLPEMIRPTPVEPKPANPYLQETLPAAEADANLAKYLEESAEKERWYTGTSSDVQEFNPALGLEKPGQAGATFASKNPDFSAIFARDAHLSNPNLERQLTPEKIELAKQNAEQYFRDTYPDMPEHADEMIKSIQAGKPVGEAEDALKDAYRELMPAGPNIMPVYVRTTNPFDFANPEHVASLKAIYPDLPELNRTSRLELPEVQDAIKKAGFDAFYTAEGGNRNIGLFQPTQLKSAIGNQGTYDVTNPLISKKDGGLVTTPDDFTTPDMSDSSKFFTDPDFARFVMEQSR